MSYYVYLIQSGKGKNKPVKIGIARNVERRISELQIGNPETLQLIAKILCNSKSHAHSLEYKLHKYFWRSHINGEWFNGRYVNLKNALSRMNIDRDVKKTTNDCVFGNKKDETIERLRKENRKLSRSIESIDEALDRIQLLHMPK